MTLSKFGKYYNKVIDLKEVFLRFRNNLKVRLKLKH
jgi:hypothetical protein